MAFELILGGTVPIIRQTGIDLDLSELANVSIVNSIRSGTDLTHSQNIYDIGDALLEIGGVLDINAYHDMIIGGGYAGDSGIRVINGGFLTILGKRTQNGTTRYTESLWYHCTDEDRWQDVGFEVRAGGTFHWRGGGAFIPRGIEFDAGSSVVIEGVTLDMATSDDDNNPALNEHQIRQASTDITVDGMKLRRGSFTFIAIPNQLLNYAPEHCNRPFGFSSLTPNIDFPARGYLSLGDNNQDVALWAGSRIVFTNPVNGARMLIGPNSGGNSNDYGFVVTQHEFNPLIVGGDDMPVAGVVIMLQDYDNGNRETYTRENYLTSAGLQVDPNQTFTYQGVTVDNGMLASDLLVYTGFNAVSDGTIFNTPNTGVAEWDYRCRDNDGTGAFEVFVASYNHEFIQYTVIFEGSEVVTTGTKVVDDRLITELNPLVTAQQTQQNNINEAYDGLKYIRVDPINYNRERSAIVSKSGITMDAGSYDVHVSATGSGLPTFDGQLITLHSSNFTSDILTTGTVTGVENVSGNISDSNGDSNISITTPANYDDEINAYLTFEDRKNEVNVVASGSSFRYQSAEFGGITLFFDMIREDGEKAQGTYNVPVEAGAYSVPLVVTEENSALGNIETIVRAVQVQVNDLHSTPSIKTC